MSFIQGTPRSDVLLFPEAIDDYVTDDNSVRFIEAFVDHLDLNQLGFSRTAPAHTGRPAYDPADLLKLYIYGYINRTRSSRLELTRFRGQVNINPKGVHDAINTSPLPG